MTESQLWPNRSIAVPVSLVLFAACAVFRIYGATGPAAGTVAVAVVLVSAVAVVQRRSTRLRSDLETVGDWTRTRKSAVVMTDADGKISVISPGFCELTGFDASRVLGRTPDMVLHGQKTDPTVVDGIRRRMRSGKTFKANVMQYHHNDQPVWVTAEYLPVKTGLGDPSGYVITLTPIAPQKTGRPASSAYTVPAVRAA